MNQVEIQLAEREFYPSVQELVRRIRFHNEDVTIREIIVNFGLLSEEMERKNPKGYYRLEVVCLYTIGFRSRYSRYDEYQMKAWPGMEPELIEEEIYESYYKETIGKGYYDLFKVGERHYMMENTKMYETYRAFMVDLEDYKRQGFTL